MTQAMAKYAAKKMLSSEMAKYKSKKVESNYDPYYEMIDHPSKPGKKKKVKKQIPSYIPQHDAEILAKARKSAYRLDFCLFNFLGIRFGWSSVAGLVPVIGDGLDAALAAQLINKMRKVEGGLPSYVLGWMFIWWAIDFAVGLVPFVGDLADASIKCNSRNVRLLEQHLDKRYKPKSLTEEQKRKGFVPAPATVYEDFSDEEPERGVAYDGHHDSVRQPARAHSGRRDRIPDEEMGLPRDSNKKAVRSGTKKGSRR